VRSDYESYKGYVKAADNLVTAMEIVDAVGISVGLSGYGAAGAGLTQAPMAMSRYLAAGARYAPRAGGAAYGAKSARDALKASEVSTSSLSPTHYITKSKTEMQKLLNDIRANGIKEPIKFVEHNGAKFILDGHHRYYSALKLGIRNVPAKQVKLPWGQYKTPMDLMIERGKNPAFWKFIK
jgi:ParB-like nuclease domain